jgi:hypothetical protein
MAVALAVVALATPAHGMTIDEEPFGETSDVPSFVLEIDDPADQAAEECVEEEDEAEEEAEEVEEEAAEEEVECEAEAEDASPFPPEECLLRTARARAFSNTEQDKLRLAIHYTALVPIEVSVEYRLEGGKGTLRLREARRHFSQHGVFRTSETLNEAQMTKVRAARDFAVQFHIPDAPTYCNRYYERRLSIRHSGAHHRLAWLQSDSIFGPGA